MTEQTAAGKGTKSGAKAASAPAGPPTGSTRAALGGWLEGPNLLDGEAGAYRGERLGLPESGSGSLAGQGRRLGALLVDWAVAYLIVLAFGWHPESEQGQWGVLAVFAAEHLLLLSTLGYTIGKRIFGMRVGKLGGPLAPLSVVIRTVLLMLVIPAVIWDRDGRGLHDRLAGTVELRR
jgi:RDD family